MVGYVKGNLITLLAVAVAVLIAAIIGVSIELAFLIWLGAFMLDASYTFLNRRELSRYELNIVVRRSRNIVTAFVKVTVIEFALIAVLSLILLLLTGDSIAVSSMFILFAVIHILAFVRSYVFMNKIKERR